MISGKSAPALIWSNVGNIGLYFSVFTFSCHFVSSRRMNSTDRKKLRGLAHHLEPIVYVGQKGLTSELVTALEKALADHELVKVKFVDNKDERKTLAEEMASKTESALAGVIGNIAIFYKQNPDSKSRKIKL